MKVIFIGNFWPFVDGGTRIARVAPLLAERGYDVHVFTMPLETKRAEVVGLKIHEVSFPGDIFRFYRKILRKFYNVKSNKQHTGLKTLVEGDKKTSVPIRRMTLRFLFKFYNELFGYPDAYKSWRSNLYGELKKFLDDQSDMCVVISEYPMTSHLVAHKLKSIYNLLWIADFVDLWSENHNYPHSFIRRFFDRRLEKKTLKNADYIVTTSKIWTAKLTKLHPDKNVNSIPHGFDDKLYAKTKSDLNKNFEKKRAYNKFSILYAGRLYGEMQDISIFFEALRTVQKEYTDINLSVTFYTPDKLHIAQMAEKFKVSKLISIKEVISRSDILNTMRDFDLMLAVGVDNGSGLTGSVPSKLYDYIAVRKPVLLAGGIPGDEADLFVKETGIGASVTNTLDCAKALKQFLNAFKEGKEFLLNLDQEKLAIHSNSFTVDTFERIMNDRF